VSAALPYRLERWVFLAVIAVTYLTIWRPLDNDNVWARMGMVFSLVERGSWNIDRAVAEHRTIDWAKTGGHYYSNKAPGCAILAVPLYAAQLFVERRLGIPSDRPAARDTATYIANLTLGILPTLFALACLWRLLYRELRLPAGWAFGFTAIWALASLALPYSVIFFGHQSAAAFFAIAMCMSAEELRRPSAELRPRRLARAALLMGVAVWTAWLLWRTRLDRRVLLSWILGGLAPAVFLLAYHRICFGSPLRTAYDLSIMNPNFVPISRWEWPQLGRLFEVTVRPYRGLFYCTPVYFLMLVGLDALPRDGREIPELWPAAVAVVASFLLLAAFPSYFGGSNIGPRYFTPALPLATLLLIPVRRTAPRLLVALAALSAVVMLASALVQTLPGYHDFEPLNTIFRDLLRSVGEMRNLLTDRLRLPLWGSFAAYLGLWGITASWLAFRLRSR
jgi:hypothetical protein